MKTKKPARATTKTIKIIKVLFKPKMGNIFEDLHIYLNLMIGQCFDFIIYHLLLMTAIMLKLKFAKAF